MKLVGTYTGNGTSQTIPHASPTMLGEGGMLIIKQVRTVPSEFSVMINQLTKAPPVYVGRPDWREVKVKKESKSSAPPKGKPIDRYLVALRKRKISSAADLAADMGISDIAVRKFMRENANINALTTMIVRKMKDGRVRYAWKLK